MTLLLNYKLPERKRPARCTPIDAGNRSVILFVTVCAHQKRPLFANGPAFETIVSAWQSATTWAVGRFVVMPNHIHLFCSPVDSSFSVRAWAHFWKSLASRQWPQPSDHPVWQVDLWDTQLRTGDSYDSKWSYVHNNPVRHGLVRKADDWPYQGHLNRLWWHDA